MNAAVDQLRALYSPESLRVLPQSVEAEQAVVGGLMLAPSALAKVSDWLTPDDFLRTDHRMIYRAILDLASQGTPYDAVTLGEWFEAQGQAELVAGGAYLVELASTTPSAANIVAYAEIVRDKSLLRQGIESGNKLVNDCYQPNGRDTADILSEHARGVTQLRGDPKAGGLVPVSSGLNDWFDDLQQRHESGSSVTGLPYPWHAVNGVTHGLQPGELTIIGARPSMGKSIMALNLSLFTALRGKNVALFSLEMTTRQVNRRNIASLADVPQEWLLAPNGAIPDGRDYWGDVSDAIRKLKSAPLLVDETAGLNVTQYIARARRAHMQRPIDLLVLDHMHDMALPGKRDARFEIGDIAAAGKMLAKEFGCPVVHVAQLNRSLESRQNKRPVMADIRESGDIEQKADVIWFLYREDYYRRTEAGYQPQHDVELILGKGRDLHVGAPILLREQFDCMALRDWEGGPPTRETAGANKRGADF